MFESSDYSYEGGGSGHRKVLAIIDTILLTHEGCNLHRFKGPKYVELEKHNESNCWEKRAIFMVEVEWYRCQSKKDYRNAKEWYSKDNGRGVEANIEQKHRMALQSSGAVVDIDSTLITTDQGAFTPPSEVSGPGQRIEVDCVRRTTMPNTRMRVRLATERIRSFGTTEAIGAGGTRDRSLQGEITSLGARCREHGKGGQAQKSSAVEASS